MGMFDEIKCDYPLPVDLPAWATLFQTKDLDNYMFLYTITADGKLVKLCQERELVPDDTSFLGCSYKVLREWNEVIPFHGDIEFYTSNCTASFPPNLYTKDGTGDLVQIWVFVARFTNGEVEWIKLVDHGEEPGLEFGKYLELQRKQEVSAAGGSL